MNYVCKKDAYVFYVHKEMREVRTCLIMTTVFENKFYCFYEILTTVFQFDLSLLS